MACKWCEQVYHSERPANFGSDPECAFDSYGVFQPKNWNCAGLNKLRALAYDAEYEPEKTLAVYLWSEDQHAALIPFDGTFIVLSYYKHRGRTEGAWIIEESDIRPLTVSDVEQWELNSKEPTA